MVFTHNGEREMGAVFLRWSLIGAVAVHLMVLLLGPRGAIASNLCIAIVPFLAAFCCLWRSVRLDQKERPPWILIAIGFLIWSLAQTVFTRVAGNSWDFGPGPEVSDVLFFDALIPLFLAISNTYEEPTAVSVPYLNLFQAALATALTYVTVFKIPAPPSVIMARLYQIYWAECLLLAIASTFRLLTWITQEERLRTRLLCAMLWLYLINWRPRPGTLLARVWTMPPGSLYELLWGVPFFLLGWMAVSSPFATQEERTACTGRKQLLIRSLFPLMITVALFGLAVSVARQYFLLGLSAMLVLLVVQGLHSGMIQVNYLMGQADLLVKEKELQAANQELATLSLHDPLTGIPNRRHFADALENEWKRALRKEEPLALVMIDVDFFKHVNDLYGHPFGDDCLVRIAQALRAELQRGADTVARYGGEEFVVLLPDTNLEGADTIARRLQMAVFDLAIENEASPFNRHLTVSLGIAALRPRPSLSYTDLIVQADRALYRSKHEGRNRISRFEEPHPYEAAMAAGL